MKYTTLWAMVGLTTSLYGSDHMHPPSHMSRTESADQEVSFDFVQAPQAKLEQQECCAISLQRCDAIDVSKMAITFPTLSSWVNACRSLPPSNRYPLKPDSAFFPRTYSLPNSPLSPIKSVGKNVAQELVNVVQLWIQMMAHGSLHQRSLWNRSNNGQLEPVTDFYQGTKDEFFPYIQKLVAQSGDMFFIHGDLHGDVRSLCRELYKLYEQKIIDNNFRIIPDNAWLLFLGDYVDRGVYGAEVIYTLLRLSLANPDRVILVRGNHEDCGINEMGGFIRELQEKFGQDSKDVIDTVQSIYNFMPVAFYVGTADGAGTINYVQCCHGGMEIGYDPKIFLDTMTTKYQQLGLLHRKSFVDRHATAPGQLIWPRWIDYWVQKIKTTEHNYWNSLVGKVRDNVAPRATTDVGFLWNDFEPGLAALDRKRQIIYDVGRGYRYGKFATEDILKDQSSRTSRIRGVIRAHQHGDPEMMRGLIYNNGVYKLWCQNEGNVLQRTMDDGLVWTFNVAPDTNIGRASGVHDYTYAELVLDAQYSNWRMKVINIKPL